MHHTRFVVRKLVNTALAACLPVLLSACAGLTAQSVATPTPPEIQPVETGASDTLRLVLWVAPTGLNPHTHSGMQDFQASRITYEPLASFDADGRLVPFLADEIPSRENGGLAADGMSVTWKLKQGVRWADGTPFTAADVRFTYEYITNPAIASHAAVAYEAVERVDVLDDYRIKVTFKAPTLAWAVPFVGRYGLIVPRHLFEAYNGANYRDAPANQRPVGTGPYRVVSFTPQEVLFLGDRLVETNQIIYEPNPYFRERGLPFFSQIELRGWGLPEPSARSVLHSNTTDYVYDLRLPNQTLQQLGTGEAGTLTVNFGSQVLLIELNTSDPDQPSGAVPHPIFSDSRVRQAIALAIDQETIARTIYGRAGRPTANVLVAPEEYRSPHTAMSFNPAQAAALLDQAGWIDTDGDGIRDKEGIPLRAIYQFIEGPLSQAVAEAVSQSLQSIGFAVQLEIVASGTLVNSDLQNPYATTGSAADIRQHLVANTTPDPMLSLGRWTCDEVPGTAPGDRAANLSRWCHATYESLYAQAQTELDAERRRNLFIQMNDLLVADGYVIPLVHVARVSGVSNTIEGLRWTPWDAEVWNIQDWRRST